VANREKISIAGEEVLKRTIMRRRQPGTLDKSVDLGLVLKEIVEWANRFVPSEAGSILLDDPILKIDSSRDGRLYFAACFGMQSDMLVGTSISASEGIAGQTYHGGQPYISEDVSRDQKFLERIDRETSYTTKSIICAPIKINNSIIGIIELINRQDRDNFDHNDLLLLEIFAGYTGQLMEKALAAREFEDLSQSDNLTGLYNDRHFFKMLREVVEEAAAKGGDVSLIFFDLDRFKEINDAHGHLAGSRVLSEIGYIMRGVFLYTGAVMARYGGDEYAIILPGKPVEEAAGQAESLRSAIEDFTFLKEPGRMGEPALNISGIITASVGIASFTRNVKPGRSAEMLAEALLKAADMAMYQSKNSGKNKVTSFDQKV
jgi:diguanylate cyclase (GGDEF)-like protein